MSDAFKNHFLDHGASDASVLKFLDACGTRFAGGDRSALFDALVVCARMQAVIPEWAADAILDADEAIDRGEMETYGDAFGEPAMSWRERGRETLIRENKKRVKALLIAHRCEDGSWNAEQAFGPVAEVTGLPRRIVEEIYRRNPSLRKIPQGNPSGTFYEQASIKLELPRRRSRRVI